MLFGHVSITRKVEFDAGHRIPNHASKCRHIHGHRYVLECTVTGRIVNSIGASDQGMVVDFGILKTLMTELVAEPWDHALLLWDQDPMVAVHDIVNFLPMDHKTVLLPTIPTAENLVAMAFTTLSTPLLARGLKLTHVRLYETPNCWADYVCT